MPKKIEKIENASGEDAKKNASMLEQKLVQLDQLVSNSNKSNSLDESIQQFEVGIELAKECMTIINDYKGKILVLKKEAEQLIEIEWIE